LAQILQAKLIKTVLMFSNIKVILVFVAFFVALNCFSQKVGLCLSGGGALGFAEIGALKALEEIGVKPDVISCCSMGSFVGVFYAHGYPVDSIWKFVLDENLAKREKMLKIVPTNQTGFSSNKKMRKILDKYIKTDCFDSLPTKLILCVTDFRNGVNIYKSSGYKLKDYVIASGSIPLLFESIVVDDVELVDGGLLDNFPVTPLVSEKCDIIIGIDVMSTSPLNNNVSKKDRINRTFALLIESQTRHKIHLCNYYFSVKEIDGNGILDFDKVEENYDKGYQQMKQFIEAHPEIKKTGRN
jgi:NTE family protein